MDAYRKYAGRLGLKATLLQDEPGHVTVRFSGPKVDQAFRFEAGKHVIQRVPPTERNDRRQTSVVSVMILPLPPEHTLTPLRDQDLDVITQTGKQKAGGQNVNKVASAVRMKHTPTGLCVFINGRDQSANKKEARRILTTQVHNLKVDQDAAKYGALRKAQWGGGGRGDKVRSYNLIESRAVDHRFDTKTRNVQSVLGKGQFELLFPEVEGR